MNSLALLALAGGAVAAVVAAPRLVVDPAMRRMLRPPGRPPRPLPDDLRERAEDVTLPCPRGDMKGWLVRPARPGRGIAVFVHGWSSDSGRLAPLARGALERGVVCLLVDLPGHGRSVPVPSYNVRLLLEDLRAVRDWLATRADLASAPAAVIGYSFGGLGALLSAARDTRWSAAASVAAPSGPLRATDFYFQGKGIPIRLVGGLIHRSITRVVGIDPALLDGPVNLREIRVPVLVVHGTADAVVPVSEADRLAAAVPPGLAQLIEIEGAGHDAPVADPAVASALGRFLETAFQPR